MVSLPGVMAVFLVYIWFISMIYFLTHTTLTDTIMNGLASCLIFIDLPPEGWSHIIDVRGISNKGLN